MRYVLAHHHSADHFISQHDRLYAYPKQPDAGGDKLVILDSGAFGLSKRGKKMGAKHIDDLSKHYRQHQAPNVIPIAPDEYLNPFVSMKNFQAWHIKGYPLVAPVIQMRGQKQFDLYDIARQVSYYTQFDLPKFEGKPFIAFSNAGWRGLEFKFQVGALDQRMLKTAFSGLWVHNLGAGWDLDDIQIWRDMGLFSSLDSIAWYTDAQAGKCWGDTQSDDYYLTNALKAVEVASC